MIPSPDPTPPESSAAVLPLARKLGEYFDLRPVEVPQPVDTPVRRLTESVWPPEIWAEMQDIQEGKKP